MMSVVVIVAMLSGLVLQHHHHDADGSVCVSLCHCVAHHGDADDSGDDGACALRLDSFCCDVSHHHTAAVQAVALAILPALLSLEPQEDAIDLPRPADVPLSGLWHRTALKRRGPPADYYAC